MKKNKIFNIFSFFILINLISLTNTSFAKESKKISTEKTQTEEKEDTENAENTENKRKKVKGNVIKNIFNGISYVSPIVVDNFTEERKRINLYAMFYSGPGISVKGDANGNDKVMANIGFGVGAELMIKYFYFLFGVDEYTLLDSESPAYTIGYKFRVHFGAIIYPKKFTMTKIYFLYRDNQLQLMNKNPNPIDQMTEFGYYSRNVGAGASFHIGKGFEIGYEVFFSILHAGTVSAIENNNYSYIGQNIYLKMTF